MTVKSKNKAQVWALSRANSHNLANKFIYTLMPVVATDENKQRLNQVTLSHCFLLVVWKAGTDGSEVLCEDRRENKTFNLIKLSKGLAITQLKTLRRTLGQFWICPVSLTERTTGSGKVIQ